MVFLHLWHKNPLSSFFQDFFQCGSKVQGYNTRYAILGNKNSLHNDYDYSLGQYPQCPNALAPMLLKISVHSASLNKWNFTVWTTFRKPVLIFSIVLYHVHISSLKKHTKAGGLTRQLSGYFILLTQIVQFFLSWNKQNRNNLQYLEGSHISLN